METGKVAALKRTALFGELSGKELAWIAERSIEVHFKKGAMLFVSGEEAKGLFVIVGGKIRVFQHNAEGREQVMHVDITGAVIGDVPIFDDEPYPASAISEEDTDLLVIEKSDVRQFALEHPSFALKALKLMARKVRRHAHLVEVLSFHEVGQRLALLLLAEAQPTGKDHCSRATFHLPYRTMRLPYASAPSATSSRALSLVFSTTD